MKLFLILLLYLNFFIFSCVTFCEAQETSETSFLRELIILRGESVEAYVSKIVTKGNDGLVLAINQIATESSVYRYYTRDSLLVVGEMFLVLGLDLGERIEILQSAIEAINESSIEDSTKRSLLWLVNSFGGKPINDDGLFDITRKPYSDSFMSRLRLWNLLSQAGREAVLVGGFVSEGEEHVELLDKRIESLSQRDVDLLALYSHLGTHSGDKPLALVLDILRRCEDAGFVVSIPTADAIGEFVAIATKARLSLRDSHVISPNQVEDVEQIPIDGSNIAEEIPKSKVFVWVMVLAIFFVLGVSFVIFRTALHR